VIFLNASTNGFQFQVYRQFTFEANDRIVSCFLNELAINLVNITGYIQVKETNGSIFIKVIVGTPTVQSTRELELTRRTLRSLCVNYREKDVIQVYGFPPVTPGIINALYGALWCKVNVESITIGEDNVLYIDVDNVDEALRILNKPVLRRCPTK
jgi:hypothetical protein